MDNNAGAALGGPDSRTQPERCRRGNDLASILHLTVGVPEAERDPEVAPVGPMVHVPTRQIPPDQCQRIAVAGQPGGARYPAVTGLALFLRAWKCRHIPRVPRVLWFQPPGFSPTEISQASA